MTTAPRTKPHSIRDLQSEIEAEVEPAIDLLRRLIAESSVEGSDAIGRAEQLIADAVRPLGGREAVHSLGGVPNLVVEWGGRTDRP